MGEVPNAWVWHGRSDGIRHRKQHRCCSAAHLVLENAGQVRAMPGTRMATARKSAKRKGEEVLIPDKLYFRIGEVSRLCRLPAYVLRFWETEFPQLKPNKSSTGQRMYRRRDLENVLRIKTLLYDQGFTIAGARQQLRTEAKATKNQVGLPFPRRAPSEGLKRVRQGLQEILSILSRSAKRARA